jgi:hypothetical protein
MLCAIGGVGVDPFSSFHVEMLHFIVIDGAVLFNKLVYLDCIASNGRMIDELE